MRWPDFLLIGAAKSGTTALFNYISQHPDVLGCRVREPNFFALEGHALHFNGPGDQQTIGKNSVVSSNAYLSLFDAGGQNSVAGEVSPLYLYHEEAPARIKKYVSEAKLIVVLRNPVERAYASYLHLRRDGRELDISFEDALKKESTRVAAGWEHLWHYQAMGNYASQLKRYFTIFERSQIKTILYDDFLGDPISITQACYAFLGVSASFCPDVSRRFNPSGIPKSRAVQDMMTGQSRLKRFLKSVVPARLRGTLISRVQRTNLSKPTMNPATRQRLTNMYRQEILGLADLIDRDLSHWLMD